MWEHQDFELFIGEVANIRKEFTSNLEIYFVLTGVLKLQQEDQRISLGKEDVAVVNIGDWREISSDSSCVICRICFFNRFFSRFMQSISGRVRIYCSSAQDSTKSYKELRSILHELVHLELLYKRKSDGLRMSLLYKLLDLLVERYSNAGEDELKGSEKIQRVLRHVHQNFQEHISLEELASEMYVSKSTLSRMFYKETGRYFADYVKTVRLAEAKTQLTYSGVGITRIAMDCGFSNASVFNRTFREEFHMTPSEYREQEQKRLADKKKEQEQMAVQIEELLAERGLYSDDLSNTELTVVEAEVSREKRFPKSWGIGINMGSVYNMTRSNIQFHTQILAKDLGFTYIRLWNVFSKHLMLTDGRTIGSYNYDEIDAVFDFLVQNNLKVYLDFGKRPDTLVSNQGDMLYYDEEYVWFASEKIWRDLLRSFMKHMVRRYGREIVATWIFELSENVFSDEENKLFPEDAGYREKFYLFYHTIKSVLPEAIVGGASFFVEKWGKKEFEEFFRYCEKEKCIPEFISIMLFPHSSIRSAAGVSLQMKAKTTDRLYERNELMRIRGILDELGQNACKLFVSECNYVLSNRDFLNDSCFRAAYIVKKSCEEEGISDMTCLWFGTDWISNYIDFRSLAIGAGGLITKDGIKKPAYYACEFLNALGNRLISCGEHWMITKDEEEHYAILCFNYKALGSAFYLRKNPAATVYNVNDCFEDYAKLEMRIVLKGLENKKRYVLHRRSIDANRGSFLNEWKKFSYDKSLKRSDIKYIQEISIPERSRQIIEVVDGQLILDLELEPQGLMLMQLVEEQE